MLSSKRSLDQRADDMGEFQFQFLSFLDGAEYNNPLICYDHQHSLILQV